jgi:hypothetical protein
MGRIRAKRPSPATVISIVALIFAVTGTAVAGVATISVLSKKEKKQTRNIAKKEINKAAPGLSVANAANAEKLGGQPPSGFLSANTVGVPIAGANVDDDGGGTVTTFFNRFGGAPTVTHTPDSGFYILSFPGLEGRVCDDNSVVLVSRNRGSDGFINRGCSGGNPTVRTRSPANAAEDAEFDIVIFVAG